MLTVYRSQASASLRRIPMWLVGSDGTTPASAGGGQPQINWLARGTATVNTAATLSLVSANAGEHYVELSASEVSAIGIAAIHYRAAAVLPNSTYFQISALDSGDSVRLGLFALPNAVAEAAGGLITMGTGTGQLHVSSGSVGLKAQTHSGATMGGLSSGVTLYADTHSGATVQGLSRINSSVTIANATYSAVTVRIDPVAYSGVTVGIASIALGVYSGVTFEVNNIAQSVSSGFADDLLRRDIAAGGFGGRSVQQALYALRNRVDIDGSTMTVYTSDDASSSWTASISTTANTALISGVNPGGP